MPQLIQTPHGVKPISELSYGDIISTFDGGTSQIISITRKTLPCYRITFATGDSIEAPLAQLIEIEANCHWKTPRLLTIKQIIEHGIKSPTGRRKLSIPACQPIEMNDKPLPIPPYTLGALLGDGYLPQNHNDSLSISSKDDELLDRITSELLEGYRLMNYSKSHVRYDWSFASDTPEHYSINDYKTTITKLGLAGTKSNSKFIPECYLYNSIENRLELIRGLMDTDGDVWRGLAHYTTVSKQLAHQVKWLIHSLGGIATINKKKSHYTYKGVRKRGQLAYILQIRFDDPAELFHLTRKKDACRKRTQYPVQHMIESIDFIGGQECFTIVLEKSHEAYLLDNFIRVNSPMNPFDEIFDTNGAIDYLNTNGKKIAHITLKKNYKHIGRLLNTRCRVYLKKELDAFIAGEDYTPDPAYEASIFDQIMTTDQAADYLGISPKYLVNKVMGYNKIQYEKRGNTALFIQEYLDQYREEHPS